MSDEEQQLYILRGIAASLSAETQVEVQRAVDEIKTVVGRYDAAGKMALALVGAELAAA